MKICLYSQNIYPLISGQIGRYGGAEVELYELSRELAKRSELQIAVVTVTNELKGPKVFEGVRVVPLAATAPGAARVLGRLRSMARMLLTLARLDADIYFSAIASPASMLCWLVAAVKGKKYVYRVVHDWETTERDVKRHIFYGSRLRRSISCMLFKHMLRHSDLIFVSKETQRQALIEGGMLEDAIVVMPNIVEDRPLGEKTYDTILWVNRIHPMKNPRPFLDLARRFPDQQFVMIAPPTDGHEELFEDIRREAQTIKNVEFIPGVPYRNIHTYYQRAKVFVLTSTAEGQSNVLIEALKSRTPVVSLCVDPDDMIARHVIGLCAEGEQGKLVDCAARLINDRELHDRCARNALQLAAAAFGTPQIALRYCNALRELYS